MPKKSKPDPKPAVKWSAWFKRSTGQFTLQKTVNGKTEKLFERLPAKSGQASWKGKEWVPAKSAIPVGIWRLWTESIKPGATDALDGIGEFFNISSGDNKRLIQGAYPAQVRWDIGLHYENKFPGSAGCIVLLHDTEERLAQVRALFKLLRELPEEYITLNVIE